MNDYFNLLKEYQELQSNYDIQKDDVEIITKYICTFANSILSLSNCIKSNSNIKDNTLNYFISLYKNLTLELKNLNILDSSMTFPLQKIKESQDNVMKQIFNSFNEIKIDLFEGKQKLNKAKKEYTDFLTESTQLGTNNKPDDNLLYEAKKQNYYILYKYEIDKMNEKIDKNNKKYNKIIEELDTINMSKEHIYKTVLLQFGKNIGLIGQKFIEFEKNLKNGLSSNNTILNNKIERFPKEIIENNIDIKLNKKNIQNNENSNNNNIINNDNDNDNNNDNKINIKEEKDTNFFDFEIVEQPISSEEAKIIKMMVEIIKKLVGENEINLSEISLLLESIKIDYKKYSLLFFSKIKEYYKNRIISLKNINNFIHLSNIINDLAIKINENNIFNEIIEISKMIKYEDVYLSSMIQKKNRFLSSKTFWIKLIEDNFISYLDIYVAKMLKININSIQKDIKVQKEEVKFTSETKDKKLIYLSQLYNKVFGIKKLNKKQRAQLEQYGKDIILKVVSKSVSNMCYFLVTESTIQEIIDDYVFYFDLGIECFYYLQALLQTKFKKQYLKIRQNYEEQKIKYGYHLSSNELIILNASKFLPKYDYINIFKINKDINLKIRTNLLKYQLTKFDISIDERIQIWEIFLNIEQIKKKYNYSEIKKNFLENNNNSNKELNPTKKKNLSIIDMDLERTPLFRDNKNHRDKASIILKCISTLESSIDYYQGMNFIILFLYQILGHDEEKTFYFFWAFETQTKYHELFYNDLANLAIYFKVYEKILEINLPDIYYSLLDKQIMTQFYSTSWFVTLFSSEINIFEREKTPKFTLMTFESFITGGWSGVFNAGLAISYYNKEKILKYDGNELMRYLISDLNNINNISDEDFVKLHKLYLNNSEKINENYILKLMDVIKFEELHKLKSK